MREGKGRACGKRIGGSKDEFCFFESRYNETWSRGVACALPTVPGCAQLILDWLISEEVRQFAIVFESERGKRLDENLVN